MIKTIVQVAGIASFIALSGCASILNEDTQKVNISASNGKEIQGNIDGTPFKGPGVVSLKRDKAAKIVTAETEGCTKQTVVDSSVDSKFFINILSGGAFGSSTDYSTGKMWKYADNVVVNCGQ